MFDLTGRVVVVSGASSGLGRQMAVGFAKQGADLVVLARRMEKLESLAQEIRTFGRRCLPLQCDVTKSEMVDAAAKQAETEFGKIDVLVNCAGSAKNAGVLNMTNEEWDFTIDTDMNSVFYVTRAFGNIMKKGHYGRIINIASMYGLVGNMAATCVPYHAAKGGVVNMTRALAAEWGKEGITVNSICPGYFITPLTKETLDSDWFTAYAKGAIPVGRYGNEGELDTCALFLASSASSYVNGQNIAVDGGYTAI